jgi:hypothetical protein
MWNLSLGLAASAYTTIRCAIEFRDADLRKDLDNYTDSSSSEETVLILVLEHSELLVLLLL